MSCLFINAENRRGRTVITKSEFTSPLKIARPFYRDKYTEIMMMSASAGMLDGDRYDVEIAVGEYAALKFSEQSYGKIFKADKIGVQKSVRINVGKNGSLLYFPMPVIPFEGSIFKNVSEIRLDEHSRFVMCDILTCGRAAMNESFAFGSYKSRTAVYAADKLVFLDNQQLIPKLADFGGIGFFDGHTHIGTVYAYGLPNVELPENDKLEAAKTKAHSGICIRILADSADDILNYINQMNFEGGL